MKILLISNMFPPHIMGGAEMAAHSLAHWLGDQGHSVHVLTSAHRRDLTGIESLSPNLTVERHYFPGPYQIYQAKSANPLYKAIWHANDHFHLAAERITAQVLQRVQPDLLNTHSLQGIGYNLLRAIAKSGVPCVQTLHDFGFQCINVNRFRDGQQCDRHHLPCQISTRIKCSYLEKIKRLSFWSPSQALLASFRPHLPRHAQSVAIPLPLLFQLPPRQLRPSSRPLRFLYVGQITPWKGVAFLLEIIHRLPQEAAFQIEVIGGGSDLAALQETYRDDPRILFHGQLPPEKVGDYMATADLLLTPSLWFENAPLVISQAIQMGLPVFASRIGGLPELVEDGKNGRLLPPGNAASWSLALHEIFEVPQLLAKWSEGALQMKIRFSVDALGERVLTLFQSTIHPEQPTYVSC